VARFARPDRFTGRMRRKDRDSEAERKRLEDAAQFYLRACYGTGRPVSASEFAAYLALARPYVYRQFTELIGSTVRTFLRDRQLRYARRLLETTPLSVEQVARGSGFASPWTFNRQFKTAFGVTPAAYRARHRRTSRATK
jgi:AraC-like DNA-binding protein